MTFKRLASFLLSLIMCVSCLCEVGCISNQSFLEEANDSDIVMNQAINKIDDFNKTLFTLVNAQNKPEPEPSANTLSCVKLYSDIGPDHVIKTRSVAETVSKQMNIKYVYEIVNYVLQTSRKNKDYNNKFKVNETYYGTARKTISGSLNALFEDPNVPDPILKIQATRDKYHLNFTADWDWRNTYLEQNLPAYNVVICTNGQIEYDKNKKDVKKIRMNWFWEYGNSEFMSSLFDFENDEFYFMSTYNSGEFHPGLESFATYYNNGTLCPQTIIEQKNKGAWVVKSNITTNASNLNYQSYEYYDFDTSTEGTLYSEYEQNREPYENLFSEVYNKVKELPLRTKEDFITLDNNSVLIDYMNDAALYGINRSRVVANDNGTRYVYMDEKDLTTAFTQITNYYHETPDEAAKKFVFNAKNAFNSVKNNYIGDLGYFDNIKYTLSYEHNGYEWDNWIVFCETLKHKIYTETETLLFEYNDGVVSNVIYTQN
ncbi:MAG: hypothetical protein J6B16_03375 [Clostridia bacterium]|nr:hypothetical protein [Clostridia bacterium]